MHAGLWAPKNILLGCTVCYCQCERKGEKEYLGNNVNVVYRTIAMWETLPARSDDFELKYQINRIK